MHKKEYKNIEKYVDYLTVIVGILSFSYGAIYTIKYRNLLGVVDLIIGSLLLFGMMLIRKKSLKIRTNYLSSLLLVFLLFLVYDGATGNVGFLWIMIYPMTTLYLQGVDLGLMFVSFGGLVMMGFGALHFTGLIDLPYGEMTIIQFNIVYWISTLLSYLAEKDRQKRSDELEELQRQLSLVINHSPLVLFLVDKNGIFRMSEGKGLIALGLKPSEVVGKSVYEIYKNYPSILDNIKSSLLGNEVVDRAIVGEADFDVLYTPYFVKGVVSGVLGVGIDMTKERKMKKKMEIKMQELENLNKLMVGRELKMMEMKNTLRSTNNTNNISEEKS